MASEKTDPKRLTRPLDTNEYITINYSTNTLKHIPHARRTNIQKSQRAKTKDTDKRVFCSLYYQSNLHCILAGNFLQYCKYFGNSVSSKNDCLASFDKLLCSWLPICIICFKSPGLLISFIFWHIKAHKLIATHCCPAFCPNTTKSP